ncbi:MAG: DUF3000 domain-containing protein [Cryobacterium sp.]|nr:DUF3000 domain-containing protein [Cryobacterium sp.]
MPANASEPVLPAAFSAAIDSLRAAEHRSELTVTEIAAPTNLAPFSIAFAADVLPARHSQDADLATGRFVLLHDPAAPEAWGGEFRVVCYVQAPLETDIGLDPFLAEVAWSWLTDALDARGADYSAASGTATKILSTGFGGLEEQGDGAQLELRASWTPADHSVAAHVEAWGELVCMVAGLPPTPDGVALLSARRTIT